MARTKGSKNGISRTKGYTAVGQRAKGRFVNGRYVYDLPKFSSGRINDPTLSEAYITTGDGRKIYEKEPRRKESSVDIGYDAYREYKRREELKEDAREKQAAGKKAVAVRNGAQNNWQQQAADAQRKAEAKARWQAGNKAMATNKAKAQGAQNNWQQQAALEQWKQQNRSNIAAKKKAAADKESVATASKAGEKNNWQNKAESSRQKSELYNKMIEKRTKGITGINKKTGDTEVHTMGVNPKNNMLYYNPVKITKKGGATTGAQNNWQQKAAREAAGTESQNKVTNGSARATYMPRRHGGDAYVNPNNLEIDTERKPNKTKGANAMRNDPRYTQNVSAQKSLAASKKLKSSAAESKIRNSRSDIGNALADAKEDARKAWKKLFSKKKKKK